MSDEMEPPADISWMEFETVRDVPNPLPIVLAALSIASVVVIVIWLLS